eukprot:TRINITY_DN67252_c11_g6_i1.p2 TRINITY_DN67252_c11_g6~~TRINITY_DN67252_c11_g6_i1.p2  ORF type:complete len:181 (-),score=0.92 TRINITY_DN67252_c11_g6_i1:260-802(-)
MDEDCSSSSSCEENCPPERQRTLSTNLLDLPSPRRFNGEYREDTCAICLERYNEGNPSMIYECGHAYHLQCAEEWRQRSPRCPVCWRMLTEAGLFFDPQDEITPFEDDVHKVPCEAGDHSDSDEQQGLLCHTRNSSCGDSESGGAAGSLQVVVAPDGAVDDTATRSRGRFSIFGCWRFGC